MTLLRLKYKARYYWRSFLLNVLNLCPDCKNVTYVTQCGRHHCSWCGKMK